MRHALYCLAAAAFAFGAHFSANADPDLPPVPTDIVGTKPPACGGTNAPCVNVWHNVLDVFFAQKICRDAVGGNIVTNVGPLDNSADCKVLDYIDSTVGGAVDYDDLPYHKADQQGNIFDDLLLGAPGIRVMNPLISSLRVKIHVKFLAPRQRLIGPSVMG